MNETTKLPLAVFLGVLAISFLSAGNALAVNVINLTGFWTDDNGNFIEIERNGPDAIAIMRSEQGRNNWMRGSMDFSGPEIHLVKKRGTRTVGRVRGRLASSFGGPRIRWDSGRVWKKSSQRLYNASLDGDHDHEHSHGGGIAAGLGGRWLTNDRTIVEVTQDGSSLRVSVVSRQGGGSGRHPWTSGHGRISNSQLSLDCFHGSSLASRLNGRYSPGSGTEARITWSNGQTWHRQPDHFRAITQPVGAVCRLPIDVIGTAIPTRATSTWQYDHGGYFHRGDDGRWNEYGAEGELRYRYREIQRTNISITLFDDRRGISVHLQKDQCWIQQSGLADWKQISPGHWSQRPPTETRRPTSNHPGHRHGRSSVHSQSPQYNHGEPARTNGGGFGNLLQGLFGRR